MYQGFCMYQLLFSFSERKIATQYFKVCRRLRRGNDCCQSYFPNVLSLAENLKILKRIKTCLQPVRCHLKAPSYVITNCC